MEYKRIVAVTGLPGLFEILSSKADGAIVRSLEDKSTRFISSRVHNLSHLESIEVYTVKDNVQLTDIFAAMKDGSQALPDARDGKALKAYFESVYPDLDFERVYSSDMKKMVKWFEIIQANGIDFTPQPEEEETETVEPVTEIAEVEASEPAAPAKKARAKKAAAPKAETEDAPAAEGEKPKRTRKKKEEE